MTGVTGTVPLLDQQARLRVKESLIKSERAELRFKIFKFAMPYGCKAQIAGNSGAIAKICNAEVEYFGLKAAGHDLIRGSFKTQELIEQETRR